MFMYLNNPYVLSAFCFGKLEMYAFFRRKEAIKVLLLLVSAIFKYFCLLYNCCFYGLSPMFHCVSPLTLFSCVFD